MLLIGVIIDRGSRAFLGASGVKSKIKETNPIIHLNASTTIAVFVSSSWWTIQSSSSSSRKTKALRPQSPNRYWGVRLGLLRRRGRPVNSIGGKGVVVVVVVDCQRDRSIKVIRKCTSEWASEWCDILQVRMLIFDRSLWILNRQIDRRSNRYKNIHSQVNEWVRCAVLIECYCYLLFYIDRCTRQVSDRLRRTSAGIGTCI